MNIDEYISERVNSQIEWYDKKSIINKRLFIYSQVFLVVFASSIPIISIIQSNSITKMVIAFVGVLITCITAVSNIFKFQENWINYRTTCESLRHAKYSFQTISNSDKDAFVQFVDQIELIISSENTNWSQISKNNKEKK